jgi:hypothetical protein
MQKNLRILFFLILVISFSCEDQAFLVKCSDCIADEPIKGNLEANLDPELFYGALIQIWEGNLEDSILLVIDTSFSSSYSREVTLNKQYTITATYYLSNDKYIAVDSATPRVKYDKSQCEDPCYYVYDRICDLRLKYTK